MKTSQPAGKTWSDMTEYEKSSVLFDLLRRIKDDTVISVLLRVGVEAPDGSESMENIEWNQIYDITGN